MKIVVIGAGSFVFGVTALKDAIERHRLDECEICLVDIDAKAARLMAAFGDRIAKELKVPCTITAHTDRLGVLPGADFVILCAAPQGQRRWEMDCAILEEVGLPGQRRECGGLGGLSNALRAITLALDVSHDMEKFCPRALLLDVTNPMPRVVTAVNRFTSIHAFGFCNVAFSGATGYEGIGRLLERPFSELRVVTAGLNHFAWLVSVCDAETGRDLLPEVQSAVRSQAGPEAEVLREWLDEYGTLAASGFHHQGEYMPPNPRISYNGDSPYHGSAAERRRRWQELEAVADGRTPWNQANILGSWEHPMDLVAALQLGTALDMPIINLPNRGGLSALPDQRIVETPATVRNGKVQGVPVADFPCGVATLCRQVSDVHELVAEGAARGAREKLADAIRCDIAIPDKQKALTALDRFLEAHRELLPQFHA